MPNSNTVLLDSENEGIFYIKTSDAVGMCNLRVFKYEEINNQPDTSQFVTRQELMEILESLKGDKVDEQPISTVKQNKSKSIITK